MNSLVMCVWLAMIVCGYSVLITGEIDEKNLEADQFVNHKSSAYDMVLIDLPVSTMTKKMDEVFKFEYNSYTNSLPTFPIKGIVLDDIFRRPVVPVIITNKKKSIQSSCVVDTGVPFSYLSNDTFKALGIVSFSEYTNVILHGKPIQVYLSTDPFSHINICGGSFMGKHQVDLSINYSTLKVTLSKTKDQLSFDDMEDL